MGTATMWESLHPLRFHLLYEQLRCPYDLPAEGSVHRKPHNPPWLSSLLGVPQKSPPVVKPETTTTDGEALSTEVVTKSIGDKPLTPLPSHEVGGAVHLPLVDANTVTQMCENEIQVEMETAAEAAAAPTSPDTDDGSSDSEFCNYPERCMANIAANMRKCTAAEDKTIVPSTACDLADVERRHGTLSAIHRGRDIAVGPDATGENVGDNTAGGGIARNGTNVESVAPPQLKQLEDLFSHTVERLYKKVEECARKVVALDDLNQQLLHAIRPPNKGTVALEDKTELAIYLHSLSQHVHSLKMMWDAHEASHLALKRRQARQSAMTPKVVRVEVVRAYEEPPVPYKKPPFTSLSAAPQPSGRAGAQSYSDSSLQSTTSGSTFTLTQTATYSHDSSLSTNSFTSSTALSETVYEDDFEDE